jgi:hypothetical protein
VYTNKACSFLASFVLFLVGGVLVSTADAQFDHLQCHKIKDSNKFKAAVVDLTAIQIDFQLPDTCTVIGKAKEFCVPVEKSVIDFGDAPGSLIGSGQDLSENDYLCYKIKCAKTTIPDTLATDQFGARALAKIKTAGKLCVPAVKGIVTTTTLPPVLCESSGFPVCDGDCATGEVCTAQANATCACLPASTACADTAPSCGGDCATGF